MAMTYAARAAAATEDSEFRGRVTIGAIKLAKYVLRTEGWELEHHYDRAVFARQILQHPAGWVEQLALGVISDPVADAIDSPADLTDEQIQSLLEGLWDLYAVPVIAPPDELEAPAE